MHNVYAHRKYAVAFATSGPALVQLSHPKTVLQLNLQLRYMLYSAPEQPMPLACQQTCPYISPTTDTLILQSNVAARCCRCSNKWKSRYPVALHSRALHNHPHGDGVHGCRVVV